MNCNGSGEILSSADWTDTQQETSRICPGCEDCEPSDLDEFVNLLQRGAELVQAAFTKPDDDWAPMGFVGNGETVTVTAAGDLDKRAFHMLLSKHAKATGAERMAFLYSAWMATTQDPTELSAGFALHHPLRQEILIITVFEAVELQAFTCPIHRTKDAPPALGGWSPVGGMLMGALTER